VSLNDLKILKNETKTENGEIGQEVMIPYVEAVVEK
jgi:hypothetical protein